jgi:hypothetical protein
MSEEHDHQTEPACSNCGVAMDGAYCPQCGQSAEDIRRPAWSLFSHVAESVFAWEGRFFHTLRSLFLRPGRVAREYIDGKRMAYTAPVRLYVVLSLVFFTVMGLAQVRTFGVEISPHDSVILRQDAAETQQRIAQLAQVDPDMDPLSRSVRRCGIMPGEGEVLPDGRLRLAQGTSVDVLMFITRDPQMPRVLDDTDRQCLTDVFSESGRQSILSRTVISAFEDPAGLEERATAAGGQVLIFMVLVFALLNLAVHPRRQLIEHAVHSLYFHGMFLPVLGGFILLANFTQGSDALAAIFAAGGVSGFVIQLARFDRGFYGSTWLGAGLRALFLFVGYAFTAIAAAIGLLGITAWV